MNRVVTAQAARNIDHDAIHVKGVSGVKLMATAGRAVAEAAQSYCRKQQLSRVQIFCGKGNNGGDGYVAAAELKKTGMSRIDVFCFAGKEEIQGDALYHFNVMLKQGITPVMIEHAKDISSLLEENACWIDAIFGTGLERPVSGFFHDIMQIIHDAHNKQPVIAVDIPSGIDGTSGQLRGPALAADMTLSMGFYKSGNLLQDGKAYCGKLQCVELDYPASSFDHALPPMQLCVHETIKERLRPISITGHKYSVGQVLCVGGSAAMPGAVTLAAQAALKSGAGMLHAVVPKSVKPILLQHIIEAIANTGQNEDILTEQDMSLIRSLSKKSRALLAGPGLGRAAASGRLLRALLQQNHLPLILDADGLFHIQPKDLKAANYPVVITPHAGEFARLIQKEVRDILDAPIALALDFAVTTDTIVHLKGSTSLTALPSGDVFIHNTGAPGMATAGSGDLLAGMIVSFATQGHSLEDATLIAAYYHGMAGQAAAETLGHRGMTASDILHHVPGVLKEDEVLR